MLAITNPRWRTLTGWSRPRRSPPNLTCQRSGRWYRRARELVRRCFRRLGNQLPRGGRSARPGGVVRVRPRARRPARRLHLHVVRADAARVHARGDGILAPAVHRLGSVRRAQGRARPARARVPQHRPSDRNGVPRRLRRLSDDVARGKRRGARPPCRGGRRCVGAAVRRVHGQCRSLIRPARHRAVVGRRPGTRPDGLPSPGSIWMRCAPTSAACVRTSRARWRSWRW